MGAHEARCDTIDVCVVGIEDRIESGVRIVSHVSRDSCHGLARKARRMLYGTCKHCQACLPWDCVAFWVAEGLL